MGTEKGLSLPARAGVGGSFGSAWGCSPKPEAYLDCPTSAAACCEVEASCLSSDCVDVNQISALFLDSSRGGLGKERTSDSLRTFIGLTSLELFPILANEAGTAT